MKRLAPIVAAIVIAFGLLTGRLAIAQTTPPYFIATGNALAGGTIFINLTGQGTCWLTIQSNGGGSTTLNNVQIFGAPAVSKLYDSNGVLLGTSISTTSLETVLFPCTNANQLSFAVTPALTYNYTLIATTQAWPYTAPVPTATPGGYPAVQPLQLSSSGALYPITLPDQVTIVNITTITTTQLVASGGLNTILYSVWVVGSGTNTAATAQLIQGGGALCATTTKTLTPAVAETAGAGLPGTMLWPIQNGAMTSGYLVPSGQNICLVSGGTAFSNNVEVITNQHG